MREEQPAAGFWQDRPPPHAMYIWTFHSINGQVLNNPRFPETKRQNNVYLRPFNTLPSRFRRHPARMDPHSMRARREHLDNL
jgi:hypothetical protein